LAGVAALGEGAGAAAGVLDLLSPVLPLPSLAAGLLLLPLLLAPSLLLLLPGLFDVDEYRSEYQPPPLRMKPVPREICRRAVCSLQRGHSVSAASFMDCSNSHSFRQDEQTYS
jgi:hypothetical protein